jgi:hypothetical protein
MKHKADVADLVLWSRRWSAGLFEVSREGKGVVGWREGLDCGCGAEGSTSRMVIRQVRLLLDSRSKGTDLLVRSDVRY